MSIKTAIHRLLDGEYFIGIVENWDLERVDDFYSQINWVDMNGYKGGWLADPFIIDADSEKITLLVEEFRFDTGRGRLSKVTVKRAGYKLESIVPILELATHLSFPHPVRGKNREYIVPENCAANEVSLYEFDGSRAHDKVKILEGRFVDTQILEHGGRFHAFTTKPGVNGGSSTLEVFSAEKLEGPYTHSQTIRNEKNTERGAGPIFQWRGRLIRPTQDCGVGYGKAVIFNELKANGGVETDPSIRHHGARA